MHFYLLPGTEEILEALKEADSLDRHLAEEQLCPRKRDVVIGSLKLIARLLRAKMGKDADKELPTDHELKDLKAAFDKAEIIRKIVEQSTNFPSSAEEKELAIIRLTQVKHLLKLVLDTTQIKK